MALTAWISTGKELQTISYVIFYLHVPREYPVAPERAGSSDDYKNYVSFLTNLKSALGSSGHKYGLTITIPSSYWYMRNFDIVSISKIVDWFNIMTYDLHGNTSILHQDYRQGTD